MAVHAGTAAGVRATEPMLTARLVARAKKPPKKQKQNNTTKTFFLKKEKNNNLTTTQVRRGEKFPAAASTSCASDGKEKVARHLLQSDMMQRSAHLRGARGESQAAHREVCPCHWSHDALGTQTQTFGK